MALYVCNASDETDVALGERVSSPAIPKPDPMPWLFTDGLVDSG